jgi:hypothetical protein
MIDFAVGDTVAWKARHLKSIGDYSRDSADMRGVVLSIDGDMAQVRWPQWHEDSVCKYYEEDVEYVAHIRQHGSRVHTGNICKVRVSLAFCDPSYQEKGH